MKLINIIKGSLAVAVLSTSLLAGVHGTKWGYTGHTGPVNWSELDPKYFMCEAGSNQSPINIEERSIVTTDGLDKIKFNYLNFRT